MPRFFVEDTSLSVVTGVTGMLSILPVHSGGGSAWSFSLRTFWRVLSRVDSSDSGGGVENLHVFRKETGVLDSKRFRIGVSHATHRLSTRKCESTRLGVPPPTPLRLLCHERTCAPYPFEM